MERNHHGPSLDFEDEYIPSGNWYPQSFDDSHLEPFFPENNPPPHYHKDNHQTIHLNTYHDLDNSSRESLANHLGNAPEPNYDSRSSNSSSVREDPFSVRCRIPVPDMEPVSGYQLWLETSFMCRRNERERQRVRSVNDGFSRLRNHLPRGVQIRRRQSKVETLRHAITYIRQLQMMVDDKSREGENEV